jgi:hypothetical protein
LNEFALAWAVIVINSVRIFLSFRKNLEDKKRGMGSHPISLLPLGSSLFSSPFLYLGLGIEMNFESLYLDSWERRPFPSSAFWAFGLNQCRVNLV